MTLKECYAALDGDYEEVFGRFLRSERMVQKYVLKFLADSNYDTLCRALEEGAVEEAFRAAHTIKGMCLNLGFRRLGNSSSQITEALRSGNLEGAQELLAGVSADYKQTIDAIRSFQDSLAE